MPKFDKRWREKTGFGVRFQISDTSIDVSKKKAMYLES
jgi:hypothetical protein